MGKIVLWIVVGFVALLALRLVNVAKLRARRQRERAAPKAVEAMVRCRHCGVFVPRAEASADGDGYRCADPRCVVGGARPP
ncbi:MAG: hypothetical protein IT522_11940 [Burkholderiales bacterium]|nr:hypothetical protein [Burkholderiales bacterium]